MSTVWKIPLSIFDGYQTILFPEGSRVVHVQMQRSHLCLWLIVDPGAPPVGRRFQVFGTGQPTVGDYVGTAMDGDFVWHVFEV